MLIQCNNFAALIAIILFPIFSFAQTQIGGGGTPGTGTNQLGATFNVKSFGAVGDAKHSSNCSYTNTQPTITCSDAGFLAGDVGKKIYCTVPGFSVLNWAVPIQTIITFNSATQVTVNANATASNSAHCVWYTQKEDAAFAAALAAAKAQLTNIETSLGSPTLAYATNVYCPHGGYVLSQPWLNQNYATNASQAVGFIGDGQGNCQIYMTPTPDFAPGANAYIGYINQGANFTLSGFSVETDGALYTSNLPGLYLNNDLRVRLQDFTISDYSSSGDIGFGLLYVAGSSNAIRIDKINLFNSQGADVETTFFCNGVAGMVVTNSLFSNKHVNLVLNGCGSRSPTNTQSLFEGVVIDECGSTSTSCTQVNGGTVGNFIGGTLWGTTATGAVSVDGTSSLYLSSMDVGAFNSGANSNAITISSGGLVEATGSNIRGNGTGAAVNGPAGATFVSVGGNKIINCSGTTCNPVTIANFSTNAFTGGIIPKSTETHTPNTCYAVTGNLLATAQNLCNTVLDQNYQLLTIAAQSGGTTPTNSACATPPVITLSDGTRSATMTMTTAKTSWSSAVDAVTSLNQVFASGATLTVSIGANTCATPPANVSVTYTMQSVLNF